MAGSRVGDCVNAGVDTLKADVTLTALTTTTKVYTHVPQGTDAPYVLVMGGDESPWAITFEMESVVSPATTDGGDNGGRQVDLIVQCVSKSRGSKEVDSLADRVMEVLTDVDTWIGVSGFRLSEFIRNSAQPPIDLSGDGDMYFVRLVTVRVSLV